MKLLIVTQYFWPETFIINDLANHLANLGHSITVLTGKPNYPDGRIYDGYQKSGVQHEELPTGVQIHRVPLRPRGDGGAVNLVLNYLSFLVSGLLRFPRIIRGRKFDVILFFAPSPMTSAITAIPLKYLTGGHLAIWVQDLWPESLSATGHISNKPALFFVRQLVRLIYRSADTLLIQSHAFYEPVATLSNASKIAYAPNFSRTHDDQAASEPPPLSMQIRQLLDNQFCLVFSGNLGTAQSLDTVLDAAALVRDISDLKILLVGSGSQSDWLEEQISIRSLDNIELVGRLPVTLMPELYRRAQGLLVTLKDHEIFSYTVPSKVQGYLAASRPILAAINGETVKILQDSGAGFACAAEDSQALADNIRKLYHLPLEERTAMGKRGLDYFMQHFEMKSQIGRMVALLEQRTGIQQV